METKTLTQTVIFKASPDEVYEALMDSSKHTKFTGSKAEINPEVGGKFKVYGGYITGENLELIPEKKIVQKWQGKDFPEDHFSKVTFELGVVKEGTKLTLTHENLPEKIYNNIESGWKEHYWNRMKEAFGW